MLDSPAGVGRGFRAAAAAADDALVICSPDPVCIRDAALVRELLEDLGVTETRLLINRFAEGYFRSLTGGENTANLRDLDDVIDLSGIQLLGIVPEDKALAASLLRGELPAAKIGNRARVATSDFVSWWDARVSARQKELLKGRLQK